MDSMTSSSRVTVWVLMLMDGGPFWTRSLREKRLEFVFSGKGSFPPCLTLTRIHGDPKVEGRQFTPDLFRLPHLVLAGVEGGAGITVVVDADTVLTVHFHGCLR